ncbi:MAG: ATP-binding protein [Actinomycetota bacterium]
MQDRNEVMAGPAAVTPRPLGGRPWAVIRIVRIFAGRSDQVAEARDFVRRVLGPVPVLDEAVLLVSELCTNSLQHTASGLGGTFEVAVLPRRCSLRVEVRDQGSGHDPAPCPVDALSEDGRGLGLVELVADHWGYSGNQQGRSVYFELSWEK